MANDRVVIACNKCLQWTTLLKFYPSTGMYPPKGMDDRLTAFLTHHADECWGEDLAAESDLGKDTRFMLHTEDSFGDNPLNSNNHWKLEKMR